MSCFLIKDTIVYEGISYSEVSQTEPCLTMHTQLGAVTRSRPTQTKYLADDTIQEASFLKVSLKESN